MKKLFIILFIISITPLDSYSSDWSYEDTIRQMTFTQTLLIDWKQTRDISKDPMYHEKNPILGKHPSLGQINNYFALCAVGHFLIAYNLPPDYRKYWQLTWIGIESNQIRENDDIGLDQNNVKIKYQFKYTIKF